MNKPDLYSRMETKRHGTEGVVKAECKQWRMRLNQGLERVFSPSLY